jgi:hypothetical protein
MRPTIAIALFLIGFGLAWVLWRKGPDDQPNVRHRFARGVIVGIALVTAAYLRLEL